jgi:hypothetical protein
MSEKEPSFIEGLDKKNIEKSASMDIKPRLTVQTLGVENGVDVEILGIPYKVEIGEKAMTDDGKLWMLNVLYEGIEHQFVAQPDSFRFQIAALLKREFGSYDDFSLLIGKSLKIWKETVVLEKWGEQALYKVDLLVI